MEEFYFHFCERYRAEETLGRELLRRAQLLPVFPRVYVCSAIQSSLGSSYQGYLPDCVCILATPSEFHLFDGHQPKQVLSVCLASVLMSGYDMLIFWDIYFIKSQFMCMRWGYNHPGLCLDKCHGLSGSDKIRNMFRKQLITFWFPYLWITLGRKKEKFRLCSKTWCSSCILHPVHPLDAARFSVWRQSHYCNHKSQARPSSQLYLIRTPQRCSDLSQCVLTAPISGICR